MKRRFYARLFNATRSFRFWIDRWIVGDSGHNCGGVLWRLQFWALKKATRKPARRNILEVFDEEDR